MPYALKYSGEGGYFWHFYVGFELLYMSIAQQDDFFAFDKLLL